MSGSPVHGELERRIVTVLFADLAGFKSLSEATRVSRIRSAEALR